jgi:WhiB family transcriptional regulator, redox-sensing transcriptional regulator
VTWRDRAGCTGHDSRLWFAELGGSGDHRYETARTICRNECPVREACLRAALVEEAEYVGNSRSGMRGGLTPRERMMLAGRLHRRTA